MPTASLEAAAPGQVQVPMNFRKQSMAKTFWKTNIAMENHYF